MSDLKEKVKKLIENEKENGRFSILNTAEHVDLIMQILDNYRKTNDIKEYEEGDELPKRAELIFVTAPTGAGKDSLVSRICHKNPEKKYIELNMDIFRHYFYELMDTNGELTDKNFAQMTNEFAYEIYYTVQEILLQEFPGTNIIITGTLREKDWVEETFRRFKSNEKTNYSVKIACLAVPKKESAISVIQRYIGIVNTQQSRLQEYPGTVRYTSMKYHDETFDRFPSNLEYFQKKYEEEPGKLIDCIEVYRRGQSVYDLDENTRVFSTEESDNESKTALDAVMKLRMRSYKVSFENVMLIINRIKLNQDYLKSQGTLRDVIKDLASVLGYPDVVKRISQMPTGQEEPGDK